MKNWLGWLIAALFCTSAFSQTGWRYENYNVTTYKNFRSHPLLQQSIDFDRIDYPLLHAAIFFVTNETRVQNKRKPLAFAIELERAAYHHSKYMAEQNFFSHDNPYSNR